MKDNYSFPGEVTMTVEQYTEIVLELDKAKRDRDMYKMSYEYYVRNNKDLEAKLADLEGKHGVDGE